jgi:glutamyl-tRNA synthetase
LNGTATISTTRIAPSPTGALHLGNARTFLVNWALARQRSWRIVLRIDDLDSPRVKPGADREALEILGWLGIDWDEGPVYETASIPEYRRQLAKLSSQGLIYPCHCTRTQIAAASLSAPHADEHELRYPGTCRPDVPVPREFDSPDTAGAAWRLRVPDEAITFVDQVAGPQVWNVQQHVGDFLTTNKQGVASYQLACVALAGVTEVVRGDDLLSSTPRQMVLQRLLGLPSCRYWHLPIVVGPDGQRLAKRHGGWTIAQYRAAGVSAGRIRALVARWSGVDDSEELSPGGWIGALQMDRLPRTRIEFRESDHDWLMAASPG